VRSSLYPLISLALVTMSVVACRTSDDPRPIPECQEYARAYARCQSDWIGADAGAAQAQALHAFVMKKVADAGEGERTALADACRGAGEQLARRCQRAKEEGR
jgi:hypothetical protein